MMNQKRGNVYKKNNEFMHNTKVGWAAFGKSRMYNWGVNPHPDV